MAGIVGSKVKEVAAYRDEVANPPPPVTAPVEATPEEQATDARRRNLLSRDRGFFGTVKTGFRGLLDLADPITQRKTLLGE